MRNRDKILSKIKYSLSFLCQERELCKYLLVVVSCECLSTLENSLVCGKIKCKSRVNFRLGCLMLYKPWVVPLWSTSPISGLPLPNTTNIDSIGIYFILKDHLEPLHQFLLFLIVCYHGGCTEEC